MKKVESEYYGIIHCIARCETCGEDWDDLDVSKCRRDAKKHTRETGHDTIVETGTATRYTKAISSGNEAVILTTPSLLRGLPLFLLRTD
jgi:hypothetical protein